MTCSALHLGSENGIYITCNMHRMVTMTLTLWYRVDLLVFKQSGVGILLKHPAPFVHAGAAL